MENDEKKPDDQEVRRLAEQIAAENLQEIKKKLDDAYARRDEALAKAEELARKSREQELAALEASGKTTEALQARLKDSEAAVARLTAELVSLKRDGKVSSLLDGVDFANARSRTIAASQIAGELTQDAQGNWVHRTGLDLQSFVKTFVADPDNAFLLKPKSNTGAGLPAGSSGGTTTKRLSEMTTQELLEAAQQGRLGS